MFRFSTWQGDDGAFVREREDVEKQCEIYPLIVYALFICGKPTCVEQCERGITSLLPYTTHCAKFPLGIICLLPRSVSNPDTANHACGV